MFERKVLRTIYGPVCVDGEWRTRYNHELYSLYKYDQVTKKIRVQRLMWLGHLARMNDDVYLKGILRSREEGVVLIIDGKTQFWRTTNSLE